MFLFGNLSGNCAKQKTKCLRSLKNEVWFDKLDLHQDRKAFHDINDTKGWPAPTQTT